VSRLPPDLSAFVASLGAPSNGAAPQDRRSEARQHDRHG
jgi:hypothetical protein